MYMTFNLFNIKIIVFHIIVIKNQLSEVILKNVYFKLLK